MRLSQIKKSAEEMQVPLKYAIWCRLRYLESERQKLLAELLDMREWGSEVEDAIELQMVANMATLLLRIDSEMRELKRSEADEKSRQDITDEMVERARKFPVELLIDFRRGKVSCFAHNDKNPSMYHGTRTNQACCPVCAKSFDPIAILMERDGKTFKEAVKCLQG